jgi:hypothetical protein
MPHGRNEPIDGCARHERVTRLASSTRAGNEKVMVKRRQKSLRPATRINIPNAQDRGSPFEPSNCWQFAVSLAIPRENPATFSAAIHRNTQSDLADYRRTAPAYRNNLRHSCPTKLSR